MFVGSKYETVCRFHRIEVWVGMRCNFCAEMNGYHDNGMLHKQGGHSWSENVTLASGGAIDPAFLALDPAWFLGSHAVVWIQAGSHRAL